MAKWTSVDGIIPGEALDAIRKNSVNAAVRKLMAGADPTAQQQAAASVMANIKPLIIDAIENAGGTGYRQYLANYTKGSQNIAARKLSAEARKLYRDSPDLFVKLVEGNSPEAVEKIMGKGNYNLALELSQDALGALKTAATQVTTRGEIAKQATAGEKALVDLMSEHSSVLKIPNWFDPRITTANKALDIVEKKVGKATLKKLSEAAKNVDNFEQLLSTLPASERNAVLKAMKDPKVWEKLKDTDVPRAITSGAVNVVTPAANNLAPAQQNQNALAR
jgi:ribosomal protein S7